MVIAIRAADASSAWRRSGTLQPSQTVTGAQIMNQDEIKRLLGIKAADYIDPWLQVDAYIGVGTGSTANHFIDALAGVQHRFAGAVASSVASADRLKSHGIRVVELNEVSSLAVYVDGADEINPAFSMIKGGGAALKRQQTLPRLNGLPVGHQQLNLAGGI